LLMDILLWQRDLAGCVYCATNEVWLNYCLEVLIIFMFESDVFGRGK